MTHHTTIAAAALAALTSLCMPMQAQTNATTQDEALTLVHRFTIPAKVAWGPISIELSAGGWRVGRLDGPLATEAQLRAVLARLTTLEVGGRCAGWVEGLTSYPCGFAIADLDLGGAVQERFSGITADWNHEPGIDAASMNPTSERSARPDLAEHGLISPVLDAERFVALRAPLRYLGEKGGTFGQRIEFRFRAVTNPLVPSEFDRASGAVVLRADPRAPVTDEPLQQRGKAPGTPV